MMMLYMIKFTSPLFLFGVSIIMIILIVILSSEECIIITEPVNPPICGDRGDSPLETNVCMYYRFVEKCTNMFGF